jgi:hypothetical protein
MKYKTTKKAVMNGYYKVLAVPYCDLQHLLHYENEIAYTTRSEGWGADIYQFGSTAIATGYAPFGNVRPSYDLNKKYDDLAREITCSERSIPWEEQKAKLDALIQEYIKEALNNA